MHQTTRPTKDDFIITFQTRCGIRSYQYDRVAGIAIMAGPDPHSYYGEVVTATTVFADVAQDVEELAELL